MLRNLCSTAIVVSLLSGSAQGKLLFKGRDTMANSKFTISYSSAADSGEVNVPSKEKTSGGRVRLPGDKSWFQIRRVVWSVEADPVQFPVHTQNTAGEDVPLAVSLTFDDFIFRLDGQAMGRFALEPCGDFYCTEGFERGRVWNFAISGDYSIKGPTESESGDFTVSMLPTYKLPMFQLDLSGPRPSRRYREAKWPTALASTVSYEGGPLFDGTINGADLTLSLASFEDAIWTSEIGLGTPEPTSMSLMVVGAILASALPMFSRRHRRVGMP